MPTGTVTFLFSDIEGSTQRWERHPNAMGTAVARHEAIVNQAVTRHGGFVFKTIGDAFCVAFATARQAVGAACDAQQALANEDFGTVEGLRVRIGLHTGHAEERNTDYFGPTVNRVARLVSIGHGGQVLLSATTRDLAHEDLPTGTSLVDLGSHRLKDLTEPEHVWQLNVHGLPNEFPSLRSLNALPHNLPIKRTTFVGRERDVAEVKELMARHHVLTLAGSGGVGKTRLAVQAAAELLDQYPDGVWFIDLAPISDAELVASVTSQVLGIAQRVGSRVDESIPPWLKQKKLLLIFDNCEHVLETVAALAVSILRAAPDVRILNTSRQVLGIGGEEVLRLRSLEVPHQTDVAPSRVLEFGSVGLFVDRARSVDKSFALTDNTAPIVADICRRLDGIPLAIELAAARVKVLSIPNLAKRLDERFKILTGGSRDVLPRQKTLSALIDWSYDLLDPQEQLLFKNLGIFAGGFDLDAATNVCAEGMDDIDVLDLLASLTDKSLVVADTSGEKERYHLLESTRAYALDKLTASNTRDGMARRHAAYFRDKAQATAERYNTEFFSWPADVKLDLDDYRSALEWSLTQGNDATIGGTIAGELSSMWRRGLAVEGRYWIVLALERVDEAEQPWIAARLWHAFGVQSSGKQKFEAAERAVRLFGSVDDARWAGYARISLGRALLDMGRFEEASEEYSRALSAVRASGDKLRAAICLHALASIGWIVGDRDRARELFAQSLAAHQACDDEEGTAQVQADMAEFEFAEGHPERALLLASQALGSQLRRENARTSSFIQLNSAAYRIALGDSEGGRRSAREGVRLARQGRVEQALMNGLQHLALIAGLRGESRRAARLMGYVDAQNGVLGLERQWTEKWGYEKLLAALRDQLSDAEIATLAAEGAAWSEDLAVEEAMKA